jgi:hypothetical protein
LLAQQVGGIRIFFEVLESQPLVEPHQGYLESQSDVHPARIPENDTVNVVLDELLHFPEPVFPQDFHLFCFILFPSFYQS